VRLGEIMEEDHFNSRHYYHLACFKLKPLFRNIDPRSQIYKIEDLDGDDQNMVIDHIQREVVRMAAGGKGKKDSAKKAKDKPTKEREGKEEEEEVKDDEKFEEEPRKRLTRSTSRHNAKSKPKPKRRK
jgi:ribosomal protein L12E/L44/L45/RPP1/RPP2